MEHDWIRIDYGCRLVGALRRDAGQPVAIQAASDDFVPGPCGVRPVKTSTTSLALGKASLGDTGLFSIPCGELPLVTLASFLWNCRVDNVGVYQDNLVAKCDAVPKPPAARQFIKFDVTGGRGLYLTGIR